MNEEEFQEYVDTCFGELETKQQSINDAFGFDSFEQYQHDFEKQELYFLKNGKVRVKAKIIPIGSFSMQDNTWMWAWANEAFSESLRKKSERLRELKISTSSEIFINTMSKIDQGMAWEIAAVSLNYLGFDGVYHDLSSETQYFYAMEKIIAVDE